MIGTDNTPDQTQIEKISNAAEMGDNFGKRIQKKFCGGGFWVFEMKLRLVYSIQWNEMKLQNVRMYTVYNPSFDK